MSFLQVSDLDRDITMSVQLRNLTNLESVIRFGEEPQVSARQVLHGGCVIVFLLQFDWTIPINFTATSHKQNIKFLPDDHRVTFLKRLSYSPTDAELPSGLTVINFSIRNVPEHTEGTLSVTGVGAKLVAPTPLLEFGRFCVLVISQTA